MKNKKGIRGQFVSPSRIEIFDSSPKKLSPGQKVLIYKETNKDIVSATGKVLGKRERVIGSGRVKIINEGLVVEIPQKTLSNSHSFKVAKTAVSVCQTLRTVGKLRRGKNRTIKIDRSVLIKAVEE